MPYTDCSHCDGHVGIVTPDLCYKCGRSPTSGQNTNQPLHHNLPSPTLHFVAAQYFNDDDKQLALIDTESPNPAIPKPRPRRRRHPLQQQSFQLALI